ncbi:uncharacterized protein LOC117787810 [Drosophila innubila]|uniref:uncharacterized protein LOC117787810 n=1 Tax=Drosophila innubila TaxID=198719 RepID=UPI00148DC487|nr:uncharacterized protein LOC117787810 [Drosophila innubila]
MELESKTTTILDLPIEVLDLVLGELRQLKDKVNFGRAHPFLREVFIYHSRNRFNRISLQAIQKNELSFVLKWCGTKVTSITCENGNGELTGEAVKLAGDYCPNLESLDILITAENVNILEENMIKLQNLDEIEIYSPKSHSDVDVENLLRTFQQLPKLQSLLLNIYDWKISNLTPLNNLTKVENLTIWRLDEPEEVDIFSNLWGNLTSLTIDTDSDVYNILCDLCVKLETLEMRNLSDYYKEGIGYFPKLKHLYYDHLVGEGESYGLHASLLSDKYNNQLESLLSSKSEVSTVEQAKRLAELRALKTMHLCAIASSCIKYIASIPLEKLTISYIDWEDLFIFLRECKTLRWLLVCFIEKPEQDFTYKLLNILEANGVQPEKPFVLEINRRHYSSIGGIMPLMVSNSKRKLLKIKWRI